MARMGRGSLGGGSRRGRVALVVLVVAAALYAVITKPSESAGAIEFVASGLHTFITSF